MTADTVAPSYRLVVGLAELTLGGHMGLRVLFAAIIVAFWSAIGFAAPVINLAPTAGPPTTKVTATGGGFTPFAAIDVYFDTDGKCLTLANGSGNFSCIFTVPGGAQPQVHWVSAVQRSNQTGAQAPFQVRTDWLQSHGRSATHTGLNPFENTIAKANVADLDLLWSRAIGNGSWGAPIVYGNNVYVVSKNGSLFAFNALTGAVLGGFPKAIGTSAVSSPAIISGNVFAVGSDGTHRLWGFNALTGAAVPGFPVVLPSAVVGHIAVGLGKVYVATGGPDSKVHAFGATNGAPVPGFPVQLSSIPTTGPAIADGIVYITDSGALLYLLDAAAGGSVEGPYAGRIASADITALAGGIYYPSNLQISGYTGRNPANLPGYPVGIPSPARLSIGRGLLVTAADDSVVRAYRFHAPGFPLLWSVPLDVGQAGTPAIAGDLVFVNTLNRLYALAIDTGAVLWSAAVPSEWTSAPVVTNGVVYLANNSGRIFAFSINGQAPAARLPGGAMGVRPALSDLTPDPSLPLVRTP